MLQIFDFHYILGIPKVSFGILPTSKCSLSVFSLGDFWTAQPQELLLCRFVQLIQAFFTSCIREVSKVNIVFKDFERWFFVPPVSRNPVVLHPSSIQLPNAVIRYQVILINLKSIFKSSFALARSKEEEKRCNENTITKITFLKSIINTINKRRAHIYHGGPAWSLGLPQISFYV